MSNMRQLIFIVLVAMTSNIHSQADSRLDNARRRAEPVLRAAFAKAGVAYPASELFIRAFKREGELELWAKSGGKFVKVATFPILAASGQPGPKRKEGDRQVPEGFYEIDRYNPASLYHLSLGLNYPNTADRILSDRERPGSDIFIHGRDVTIGCLPMGDEGIEQIYIAANATKLKPVKVHIFPARMAGDAWREWSATQPEHAAFWAQLLPAFEHFEKKHTLPEITVQPDGKYRVNSR